MMITLCYSMQFAERAVDEQKKLQALGHTVFVTDTNDQYIGLSPEEKQRLTIDQKNHHDAIMCHYNLIKKSDAILVLNYDKNNIHGYIGGNAFLEIGFAYTLGKRIYLLYPIPEMGYTSEIVAMKPIVLDGDLKKI